MSFTVNNLKISFNNDDGNNNFIDSGTRLTRVAVNERTKDNEFADGTNYGGQMALSNAMDSKTKPDQAAELERSRSWMPEGTNETVAHKQVKGVNGQKSFDVSIESSDLIESADMRMSDDHKMINHNTSLEQLKHAQAQEKSRASSGSLDQIQLTNEQLINFVSAPVPKNKRVLCLIVRDKISKLNQAKSYFYPTYYLFIQAIIDIEGHTVVDNKLNSATASDDLVIGGDKVSADNSFSASSSISADMMFIGTENNLNTQSMAFANKLSGTSYSDTELNHDAENDDDSKHHPINTPDLDEKVSPQIHGDMIKNDLIVYPDKDPKLNAELNLTEKFTKTSNVIGNRVLNRHLGSYDELEKDDIEDDESDVGECNDRDDKSNDLLDGLISSCSKENDTDYGLTSTLFDNGANPFTGTCGVVLSGRKRKKAKT
jgi:hypothetical protein